MSIIILIVVVGVFMLLAFVHFMIGKPDDAVLWEAQKTAMPYDSMYVSGEEAVKGLNDHS